MMKYLTIQEAAKIVRVHPQTIRNWIKAKVLPATKPKGKVFIKSTDLEELMNR